MPKKPVKAILLGAGGRGQYAYGPYAQQHPHDLEFVAVAEPNEVRRARFATMHDLPAERQFTTWEDALNQDLGADVVFNMTQDQMHYESSLAALAAGYDLLLEKPMTNTLKETMHLVQLAEQNGRLLQICHVLRYTDYFSRLNHILRSGRLGDIVSVEHRENVVYWHMAHSFVRGNWRNTAESSPMILAKCCHDLDILYWNMGCKPGKLQSFGSLHHFRPEKAPEEATRRCTNGCPVGEDCAFDARRLYLNMENEGFMVRALTDHFQTLEGRLHALQTGPYGRCVYQCDNDVVDNQTVNMMFENGATGVLFMHGHAHEESRTMRYDGTRATLRGRFYYHTDGIIEISDHLTGRVETLEIPIGQTGHGGGDEGIVGSFVRAVRGDAVALTTARESLESHLMAFAAEESRLNNTVVDMADYRQWAEQITAYR